MLKSTTGRDKKLGIMRWCCDNDIKTTRGDGGTHINGYGDGDFDHFSNDTGSDIKLSVDFGDDGDSDGGSDGNGSVNYYCFDGVDGDSVCFRDTYSVEDR